VTDRRLTGFRATGSEALNLGPTFTWRPIVKSHRRLFVALAVSALAISLVSCNSGGTSATSPVDLSPPQAPTNLHSMTDTNINRDWLVWDLSASANVAGYQIYSTSSSGGSATLVATVDASSSDYLLPLVGTSTTEYYRVRAMGTNSVPSAFTSTLGVDRTGWDGSPTQSGPTNGTKDPN
jgi:hypothetical protein